ncbi:MAG: TonB C-terminal domain-containing protein [Cyanobacteria bacterium SZAS TMP-1]|nr:TonB C-terminal domain-containing protein [Cyanobacteria bacterium SZAS TMP-1]
MKNDQSLLSRIEIAKPCSADWESMSGDERERHCQLCQLNVYNISDMTKSEAEAFLAERIPQGRVCVRLFRRTDGTIITDDCPRGLRAARDAARRLKQRVAAAASLLLTFLAPMAAQSQNSNDKKAGAPLDGRMGDVAMPPSKVKPELTPTAGKPSISGEQGIRGEATVKPPIGQMMGGICPIKSDMPAYMQKLREKVNGNLPSGAIAGLTAEARTRTKILFKIQRNGSVSDLKVGTSCGDAAIDKKIMAAIKKSAPFGALSPAEVAPYQAEFTP